MPTVLKHRKALLDALKMQMSVEIKLDVAEAIRHHPHLTGNACMTAYDALASDQAVESMIKELAREEIVSSMNRGDKPTATMIHLAGYPRNSSRES